MKVIESVIFNIQRYSIHDGKGSKDSHLSERMPACGVHGAAIRKANPFIKKFCSMKPDVWDSETV
jgi:hypothetical protein